jgi:aminoglycoside phosphotransferase (APT) family kinase protein
MIREWKVVLSENARQWALPVKGEWTFLLHNNYQPNYSGVNLFWFHDNKRDPLVVTKVFPEPSLANQEFRNLSDAHSCAPREVPKPLGLFEHRHSWALWMSGVTGSPLTADLLSDSMIDRFCDTLVAIQVGVAKKRPADPDRWQDAVYAPLEFAAERSPTISEACRQTLAAYANGKLDRIPSLPQHGDLYSGNIIIDTNNNWGIVDWELFGNIDLPFYDVVRFLFSLDTAPTPDRWNAAVQQCARRLIARYTQAIRMQAEEFTSLLPLLLANWHYRQPLPQGKALALRALEDYYASPTAWERTILR